MLPSFSRVATGLFLSWACWSQGHYPRFVSPGSTCVTVSGLVIDSSWVAFVRCSIGIRTTEAAPATGSRSGSALINALLLFVPTSSV